MAGGSPPVVDYEVILLDSHRLKAVSLIDFLRFERQVK